MTFADYMSRVLAVILAASPREALERIAIAATALVFTGWFLISGLPHAVWLLPWGVAMIGTLATLIEVLVLALNDDNFDDDEDGESDAGWELGA